MNSIPYFWSSTYHILGSRGFIFSFPEFQAFPLCLVTKLLLNHYKVSPCVFNFSWFYHHFVYRSSSWMSYMMVHRRFISFLKRSSTFFSGVQAFFILQSGLQFFLSYHWRWYYVILHNLSSCFMIHMLSRLRYLKSIKLVMGVILGYISPKAFPKDCCYLWCK